jgi:hypothetical protein
MVTPTIRGEHERHDQIRRLLRGYDGVVSVDTIPPERERTGALRTEVVLRGRGIRSTLLAHMADVGVDIEALSTRQDETGVWTTVVLR